ncbi:uncharacterized protein LOC110067836 isoform X2 [Orbicella faveolata]|uniref:uncharacterized protein LOC110067836 isoform X2 n=1 Tax=Orbicella faveolata TaxID=48498 RepID=UPI0009E2EB48|nr:uncharacterized protein LOC110067836 isoform X2 [Orbicella faveolata]
MQSFYLKSQHILIFVCSFFERHIIAALYSNLNLLREVKKNADGTEQVKVVWSKFKNGKATVRDVKVEPNYDYVEDIYQTYIESQEKGQLGVAMQELSDMNPPPMNTMLERQSREEAIVKRAERKGKTVKDVPPTTPVTETHGIQQPPQATKGKPRYCSTCQQPMKGHKNVTTCPKNQKGI